MCNTYKWIVIILTLILVSASSYSCTQASNDSKAIQRVVSLLEPSVVKIELPENKGSGVIITNKGHVITTYHVVKDATSIKITLMNDDSYDADVIATDEEEDLAILKIASERTDFQAAKLGTLENIFVGEDVLAIGYPHSYKLEGPATFTKGIISAFQVMDDRHWIQTDAAVNRGNSGGPLVNLSGEIIGIVKLELVDEYVGEGVTSLNFAIPIDEVKAFINTIPGMLE